MYSFRRTGFPVYQQCSRAVQFKPFGFITAFTILIRVKRTNPAAIETWQSSDLSVRQFCRQEGLSEPSFYSWRKKLTKCDEPEDGEPKEPASSDFIAVSLPENKPAGLELILSSGNTLRIGPSVDSKALIRAISVLQSEINGSGTFFKKINTYGIENADFVWWNKNSY